MKSNNIYMVVDIGNTNCKINVMDYETNVINNTKIEKHNKYDIETIMNNLIELIKKYNTKTILIGSVVLNIADKIIQKLKIQFIGIDIYNMDSLRKFISYEIDEKLLNQKGIDLIGNTEFLFNKYRNCQQKGIFLFGTASIFISLNDNKYNEIIITLGIVRTIVNLIKDASILRKRYYKTISKMSNQEIIEFTKVNIPNVYKGALVSANGFINECHNTYLDNNNSSNYLISGGDVNLIDPMHHKFIEQETTSKGYLLIFKNFKRTDEIF